MERNIIVKALECLEGGDTQDGELIIHKDTLRRITDKGQNNMFAQFDKLVGKAVLNPDFIFSGLERDLFNDGSLDGDNNKLIYVFDSPKHDYIWKGSKNNGAVEKVGKPENKVFIVLVSKNERHKEGEYSNIFGFIEEWNWCEKESQGKKPIDWIDRYDKLIFKKDKLTII